MNCHSDYNTSSEAKYAKELSSQSDGTMDWHPDDVTEIKIKLSLGPELIEIYMSQIPDLFRYRPLSCRKSLAISVLNISSFFLCIHMHKWMAM